MRFCTVINCMDGRVQLPVIHYLRKRWDAEYVDSITEPGPNLILAEHNDSPAAQSILNKIAISVEKHHSRGIAVVGHYDCAGNPAPKEDQIIHIQKAVRFLRRHNENLPVIGLWVDHNWEVHEVSQS